MTLQNRMECQLRTPCEPRTSREHAHCTIRHTPGISLEQLAAATSIPVKRLMKISAPQGDTFAKPEEIAAICRVTQRFAWLRFYVRQAGCELFELPDASGSNADAEVLEQTSATLQSLSKVIQTLTEINGDRRIRADERAEFKNVVGQHMAAIARLEAWVDKQCVDERQPVALVELRRVN